VRLQLLIAAYVFRQRSITPSVGAFRIIAASWFPHDRYRYWLVLTDQEPPKRSDHGSKSQNHCMHRERADTRDRQLIVRRIALPEALLRRHQRPIAGPVVGDGRRAALCHDCTSEGIVDMANRPGFSSVKMTTNWRDSQANLGVHRAQLVVTEGGQTIQLRRAATVGERSAPPLFVEPRRSGSGWRLRSLTVAAQLGCRGSASAISLAAQRTNRSGRSGKRCGLGRAAM